MNSPFRLRQASRFTPFSPDRFPARKAYGAGLAHDRHITFVVHVMRQLDFLSPVIASLKGEAIQKEVTGLLRVNPRNDGRKRTYILNIINH
ncbi:MAG: hypothetical protein LBL79_10685 [Prevotella sp.]|jgi:hypothetical protein|nr:hypothetical protein [Prevotella sp.]